MKSIIAHNMKRNFQYFESFYQGVKTEILVTNMKELGEKLGYDRVSIFSPEPSFRRAPNSCISDPNYQMLT